MTPIKKAVIPVAGMGTRFLPATKAIPKELLPLVDKPVVQYIVEEAVSSGIEEIIFVTSAHKGAIEKYFSKDAALESFLTEKGKETERAAVERVSELATFTFVEQDSPRGLGHAVLQAKAAVGNEPFVVFGGDDVVSGEVPAAQQLIDCYKEHGGSVIGVIDVPTDRINRYGVVDPEKTIDDTTIKLKSIVEKPSPEEAPSSFGAGGRWLLTPEIFTVLEKTTPGAGGEIQLTDAILALMKDQPVFAKVYSGTYHDCGNIVEYAKAVIHHSLLHPETATEVETYIRELHLS